MGTIALGVGALVGAVGSTGMGIYNSTAGRPSAPNIRAAPAPGELRHLR